MEAPLVVLDDARPGHDHLTLFSGFQGAIQADTASEVPEVLATVDRLQGAGEALAGYFSYELGYALEPKLASLMPQKRAAPLLWFGRFAEVREIAGRDSGEWFAAHTTGRAYAGPLEIGVTPSTYEARFKRAQDFIRAGDIYQVNLTFPARFAFAGDPLALYRNLRRHAAAGHGAFIDDGERAVLSLSPELFFDIDKRILIARPMKGTAPRDADADADEELRAQLGASEKDRAENLMIVDLIRNDVSRIAQPGSVGVDNLFSVETYPTVHQMVSTVYGGLRADARASDIVRALFPCGSITGAPKIRAMEIIRELESGPRGLYCGAIGAFFPKGDARFNVAIRTLTISGHQGTLGIGSGIVADSRGPAEYEECVVKARFFSGARRPIGLIETLRFELGQGFVRQDLHLARLGSSANALGIPFDKQKIETGMRAAVGDVAAAQRVRLHLAESGEITLTMQALEANPAHWTYSISEKRLMSGDSLARHKIDWRDIYDGEYARLHALTGCDEVLFLNEKDEVAEGSRSNLFIRIGAELLTPPLSVGILDGCLRRALLDDPAVRCREQMLTLADFARADAVYFGNSLRGLIPAILVTG